MPTRSRNARLKARTKRTNSLLKRSLNKAAFEAQRNFSTVIMLLAHAGGEVSVPNATVSSVIASLQKAQFVIEPQMAGDQHVGAVIKLVDADLSTKGVQGEPQTLTPEMLADLKARMDRQSLNRDVMGNPQDLPLFEAGAVTQELSHEADAQDPIDGEVVTDPSALAEASLAATTVIE